MSPHYSLTQTLAPTQEPITLSEAKQYLRVSDTAEDAYITECIGLARQLAESYTRRSFITQRWKYTCDGDLPYCVNLPKSPVQSIISITAIARDGSNAVIDAGSYYISSGKDAVILEAVTSAFRTEIIYSAGFSDTPAGLAKSIKHGILAFLASVFEQRGDAKGPLAEQARQLLEPYRVIAL